MHQIFTPPFPLSIGGVIQWDRAFLNLFPTTLAQHTDIWIARIGLCSLDRFSALSHAGMMGSYMRTDQTLSRMAVDTLSCFQPFTVQLVFCYNMFNKYHELIVRRIRINHITNGTQGSLLLPHQSLIGPSVLAIPVIPSALKTIIFLSPISLAIAPLWTGSCWDY